MKIQTVKAKDLRADDVWPNGEIVGRLVPESMSPFEPLWIGVSRREDGLVDEWIKADQEVEIMARNDNPTPVEALNAIAKDLRSRGGGGPDLNLRVNTIREALEHPVTPPLKQVGWRYVYENGAGPVNDMSRVANPYDGRSVEAVYVVDTEVKPCIECGRTDRHADDCGQVPGRIPASSAMARHGDYGEAVDPMGADNSVLSGTSPDNPIRHPASRDVSTDHPHQPMYHSRNVFDHLRDIHRYDAKLSQRNDYRWLDEIHKELHRNGEVATVGVKDSRKTNHGDPGDGQALDQVVLAKDLLPGDVFFTTQRPITRVRPEVIMGEEYIWLEFDQGVPVRYRPDHRVHIYPRSKDPLEPPTTAPTHETGSTAKWVEDGVYLAHVTVPDEAQSVDIYLNGQPVGTWKLQWHNPAYPGRAPKPT